MNYTLRSLKNPDTILIQNEYYPKGLTELDINNYYHSIKNKLIYEIQNRELILFIGTDINKTIVRRHDKNDEYITIHKNNFDQIMHGRVVSIVSTMKRVESFGIIDIDYYDFKICKDIVLNISEYLKNLTIIDHISIRFTGKSSFHIIVYFKIKYEINWIRSYLNEILNNKFKDIYDISYKRNSTIPNLDLSPNKFRGGFITQYSLSIIGLKCMEVPLRQIPSFDKQFAKIK